MADITGNQTVRLRMPVAPDAAIDGAKKVGAFAFSTTKGTLSVCPGDEENFVHMGLDPADAPAAASVSSADLVLVSQGGQQKRAAVSALGLAAQPPIASKRILGNKTGTSGVPSALTPTEAAGVLGVSRGVSVVDHGAVADYNKDFYTGTNNTTAFQAAADQAALLGLPLVVPPGSYYLGSAIICTVDIIGGGEICIDHRTANRNTGYGGPRSVLPTAVVLRGSGKQIKDVNFWAPGRHLYDPALPGAVNFGMYNFVLIEGTVGSPSAANLISRCKFYGGSFGSVMFGSYCVFPCVNSCEFYGSGYHVLYDDMTSSFRAVGGYGFHISNNKFQGYDWTSTATAWATANSAWGGDPIEINAPASGTNNVSIVGNRIDDAYSSTTASGIAIGLAKVQKFQIVGNYINRCSLDGIHVEDQSSDGIISDNFAYLTNQAGGGGSLTMQQAFGITISGNRLGRNLSINGANGYAGPFLPNTSDYVKICGNYINGLLFVINQSNVIVDNNDIHNLSLSAPSAGADGIQITTGPASADSSMTNVLVENNRVSGCYRGISVVGAAGISTITNVRVKRNYVPANPLSGAPAADKGVYVGTGTSGIEVTDNYDIGAAARIIPYRSGSVAEAQVIGNKGDLCTTGATNYADNFWLKRSGTNSTGGWIPVGHLGVKISARSDGSAIDAWTRHVRYNGTGGHNFAIATATESGRKLSFGHYGTGSPITVTPASGTINGLSSISIPAGYVVDIVDDNNNSWHIEAVGGIQTGWAADTGTAKKTANATYSGTASATYSQSEMTGVMNALRDATQTIKALKDLLIARYEIGT